MLMSVIITADFFKQWCFSAEAVSGLDLHESKRSYTSNSALLNKYSRRDCVWISQVFFSIFAKNSAYCIFGRHTVSNLEIRSPFVFHVPTSHPISFKKCNSSMQQSASRQKHAWKITTFPSGGIFL